MASTLIPCVLPTENLADKMAAILTDSALIDFVYNDPAGTITANISDATLVALAAYNTTGFLVQTAADTFTGRSFVCANSTITITNPDGTAGNVDIALNTNNSNVWVFGVQDFSSGLKGPSSDSILVSDSNRFIVGASGMFWNSTTRNFKILATSGQTAFMFDVQTRLGASRVYVDPSFQLNTYSATLFVNDSSTTAGRKRATISHAWVDNTDATRKGRFLINASDATADRECYRGESDGSVSKISFHGSTAIAKPAITGARDDGTALADLLTDLASYGLVTDSSTSQGTSLIASTTAVANSNITLVNKTLYFVDTSAARNLTLPAPSTSLYIVLKDATNNAAVNNITLVRPGAQNIETVAADYVLNTNLVSVAIVSNGTDYFLLNY